MARKRKCKICGDIKIIHGRDMCDTCYHRVLNEEKRINGICISCRVRPIDYTRSTSHCSVCLDKQNDCQYKLHSDRRRNNKCIQCGNYTIDGKSLCERCSERKNEIRRVKKYDDDLELIKEYLEGLDEY